jgi:hypothetical protein
MTEQRHSPIRRDINDAVRDDNGKFSFKKVGIIAGQFIAGKYLLIHWEKAIASWDVLTVLFTVLIAPDLFIRLMNLKYGGTPDAQTTTTTATATVATVATDTNIVSSSELTPNKRERKKEQTKGN